MRNSLPSNFQDSLLNADVLEVLRQLPDNCLDMVYGDPDYNVGIRYNGKSLTKKWDDYIDWYGDLASQSMRVLREDGNLFLINYPKQNSYLRVKYLDNLAENVFEYVWVYPTNVGHSPRRFTTAHRSILHAVKSSHNKFFKDQVAQPYQNPDDKRIRQRIMNGEKGRMPYSWLNFNLVKNVSKDKTIHSCQIPLKLFDVLLKASTQEEDSVFILFGGSGSEIVHSNNANRHWVSCELDEKYYKMIKTRLSNNGAIAPEYRLISNSKHTAANPPAMLKLLASKVR